MEIPASEAAELSPCAYRSAHPTVLQPDGRFLPIIGSPDIGRTARHALHACHPLLGVTLYFRMPKPQKCQGPDGRFIEPYRYQYRRPAAICLRTNPRQRQILRTGFAILRANQGGKQLYHAPMGRMRNQSGQRLGFASAHPTEKRVLRPEILSALPLRL